MKLLRHVDVTDSRLLSHSVAEDEHAEWVSGATYAVGAYVIRASKHRIYKLVAASVSNDPPESNPAWTDVGPTNRWAAFDESVGSSTVATEFFEFEVKPGARFDCVALLDVVAESVTVTVLTGTSVVWSATAQARSTLLPVVDYYTYWMAEMTRKSVVVLTGIPFIYSNASVRVRVNGVAGGQVKLGTFKVGRVFTLGRSLYGPSVGINDYSVIDTDPFGVTSVVQRAYSKTMTLRCEVKNDDLDAVISVLTQYRSKPAVWIGADTGHESLVVYGFAKDWSGQIDYPQYSYLPIQIRGLT